MLGVTFGRKVTREPFGRLRWSPFGSRFTGHPSILSASFEFFSSHEVFEKPSLLDLCQASDEKTSTHNLPENLRSSVTALHCSHQDLVQLTLHDPHVGDSDPGRRATTCQR